MPGDVDIAAKLRLLLEGGERDYHEHCYPCSPGDGTAADPITISTDDADENNAAASTKDYAGLPMVIVATTAITETWNWAGVNLFATDAVKVFRCQAFRVVYSTKMVRNGGNNWDNPQTILTVDDSAPGGLQMKVGDRLWVTSPGYKPNGEITVVSDVTGNVITIVREASQFGGAAGLRWDHTTNDAGNEEMYLCGRSSKGKYHAHRFDYSAGSNKDFDRYRWRIPRHMLVNDGLILRIHSATDGINDQGFDMTIIYTHDDS